MSVVLLDPKAPWEKPCGGGLTPPLFEEIPELEELAPEARTVERVRIEVTPEEGFSVELERPIRIVSRKTLAAWQLERALAAGAVHLPAKVRSITHFEGGWSLDTDHGDFRVPFLVGADGAASLVRRVAVPRFSVDSPRLFRNLSVLTSQAASSSMLLTTTEGSTAFWCLRKTKDVNPDPRSRICRGRQTLHSESMKDDVWSEMAYTGTETEVV